MSVFADMFNMNRQITSAAPMSDMVTSGIEKYHSLRKKS